MLDMQMCKIQESTSLSLTLGSYSRCMCILAMVDPLHEPFQKKSSFM